MGSCFYSPESWQDLFSYQKSLYYPDTMMMMRIHITPNYTEKTSHPYRLNVRSACFKNRGIQVPEDTLGQSVIYQKLQEIQFFCAFSSLDLSSRPCSAAGVDVRIFCSLAKEQQAMKLLYPSCSYILIKMFIPCITLGPRTGIKDYSFPKCTMLNVTQ